MEGAGELEKTRDGKVQCVCKMNKILKTEEPRTMYVCDADTEINQILKYKQVLDPCMKVETMQTFISSQKEECKSNQTVVYA